MKGRMPPLVVLVLLVIMAGMAMLIPWTAGQEQALTTPTSTPPPALVEGLLPSPEPTRTATARPTRTATPEPTDLPPGYWALKEKPVPWEINCANDVAWDGFPVPELGGYCSPGVLSQETLARGLTANHYGALSSYAEGVMEHIEDDHGVARGHGVAVMSCQLIGRTVWLRVPDLHAGFQGPFTVVDCGAPAHMFFHIAGMGLAAEVGWTTAEAWGVRAAFRVDVSIGRDRPSTATWQGVDLAQWWVRWSLEWEDAYGIYGGPRGTATPTPPA